VNDGDTGLVERVKWEGPMCREREDVKRMLTFCKNRVKEEMEKIR